MDLGFSQSVNNLLLDNIDEVIPIPKSASTPVMRNMMKLNLIS